MTGLTNDLFYKSAPSAVSTRLGTFDIFATDTDDNLMTRHFDGTSWRPAIGWQHMKSYVADAGNPVAMGPVWEIPTERYDLATRQLEGNEMTVSNDEKSYTKFRSNFFGAYAKAAPLKIYTGLKSMEYFSLRLDDSIHHLHRVYDDSFPDWDDRGILGDQKFISPPTAVTIGSGRVELFGIAPDQTVMYNTFHNSSNEWTGWKQLGSRRFASSLSAIVPQGTNHIELWGLGLDGALWHRGYDGVGWPVDWDSHGGRFVSAPTVISASAGAYDVFAIGSDGALKHARHVERPEAWIPSYRGWNSLGGSLEVFE